MTLRSGPLRRLGLAMATALPPILNAEPVAMGAEALMTYADPERIAEIARGFGPAEVGADVSGDPVVSGQIQGLRYSIFFYDCHDRRDCRSIQFWVGTYGRFDVATANDWNIKHRWVTASVESDGLFFTMDFDFDGGVTRAALEERFRLLTLFMPDIRKVIEQARASSD